MKIKLLTVCLLLVTLQVFAENRFNWTLISTSTADDGNKFYGDINSIRKNKSGNYVVWMLLNNVEGDSVVTSEEYDCTRLRFRWVYVELYSHHYGKGKKKFTADTEELKPKGYTDWIYPKPNSNNYHKVNFVCEK